MHFEIDKQITLRVLQPEDAESLFAIVDMNRTYLRQWLPWLDRNTTSQDSLEFIKSNLAQLAANKGFACGVFFDGVLVGICGYHEVDTKNQSVVIGYWLSESYQGRGIISRCVCFFTNYAFEHLNLTKVLIPVAEENTKSRAVCERLSFVNEGKQTQAENLYGQLVDHICYSMSKDGWKAGCFTKTVSS